MSLPQLKTLTILFKTYQNVLTHIKLSIAESGLSINEFAAMEALYSKGTLQTKELVDFVLIPNSSMTYVLDCLEKKQFIHRQKNQEDGRIQELSLTQEGATLFEVVYQHHYEKMRSLFDILDPTQEQLLQEVLKQLGIHATKEMK